MKLSLPNFFSPKLMIYLENSNLPNACTAKKVNTKNQKKNPPNHDCTVVNLQNN